MISETPVYVELKGQGSSTRVEMLEPINKMQLQVEQQIKSQKLPKAEIMSFDGEGKDARNQS